MGSPCCPLSDLITLQPPVGKSHRELLSRGGDGAVRGRRARPKCWQQIRSQREEWKTVILLVYFYLYFFVYVCVWRNIILFCGHTCPLLLLLSGMAHNECNVRKSFGKSFFADSTWVPRATVPTSIGYRRSCLWIGHPTRTTRDQGNQGPRPFLLAYDLGIGSPPLHSLSLDSENLWNPVESSVKVKMN